MSIILFDGVCNLCSGFVRFVLPRDPSGKFCFASLQSNAGQRLLREHGLKDSGDPESIVLIQNGRAYERSQAVLRIARGLSGAWPLLSVFLLVPRPLRDIIYRLIARYRYRWFGKREQCMLPGPEYSDRFLESSASHE